MKINLSQMTEVEGHHGTVLKKQFFYNPDSKEILVSSNWARLTKGKTVEEHVHSDGKEYYFFLKGEGKMLLQDRWFSVQKDDFVTVPEGHRHSARNERDEDLEFLTIRTKLAE